MPCRLGLVLLPWWMGHSSITGQTSETKSRQTEHSGALREAQEEAEGARQPHPRAPFIILDRQEPPGFKHHLPEFALSLLPPCLSGC